jgi:hypothetical protein
MHKHFFGYRRNDSMTQVLIDTGLPCFGDVLAKYAFTFHIQWPVGETQAKGTMPFLGVTYLLFDVKF